jgi:hypothetical protein
MKWPVLILVFFACLACGGLLPEKLTPKKMKAAPQVIDVSLTEQRLHLSILEAKYLKEDRKLNLAIVRGMILELEAKNPALRVPATLPQIKDLRKNHAFLSLELTVEHLSHRDSVKLNSRHSAYLIP